MTWRRMVALTVVQIIATLAIIATAVGVTLTATANHERAENQAARLEVQLVEMRSTNRTLVGAQEHLSFLIAARGAVVEHLLCVNAALTSFATLVTVDPDLQSQAIRDAAAKVLAGIDPDGGVCPRLESN